MLNTFICDYLGCERFYLRWVIFLGNIALGWGVTKVVLLFLNFVGMHQLWDLFSKEMDTAFSPRAGFKDSLELPRVRLLGLLFAFR